MFNKIKIFFQTLFCLKNPISFFLVYLRIRNEIVCRLDGYQALLRSNSIDYWLFIENLVLDTYKLRDLNKFKIENIVDIGANIGLFSVHAKSVWPKASLVCVEPNKDSYAILKENLNLNNLKGLLLNKAVAGQDNIKIELFKNDNPAMSSTTLGRGDRFIVETISLHNICKDLRGSSLLKIDIEGGEYEIFTEQNKANLKRFKVIVMETHDIDKVRNHRVIVKFLKQIGFLVNYENRTVIALNGS